MRAAFAAISLGFSASVLAQACTVNAPAFVVSCPCPLQTPTLQFTGTARIGTLQRFNMASNLCHPYTGIFLIGLPPAVPIPIPDGLVACNGTMAPVASLLVDPVFVGLMGPATADVSGCSSQFIPFFLSIPNQTTLVGLTAHAQFFERLDGYSSTSVQPFAASQVVGFTVLP